MNVINAEIAERAETDERSANSAISAFQRQFVAKQ